MASRKSESGGSDTDRDGDGMPDSWNQRMPAVAFLSAMLALIPTLFAMRSSINEISHRTTSRGGAYALNITVLVLATIAIVCAAYGETAKTARLGIAGRRIAIIEAGISLVLVLIMFFRGG